MRRWASPGSISTKSWYLRKPPKNAISPQNVRTASVNALIPLRIQKNFLAKSKDFGETLAGLDTLTGWYFKRTKVNLKWANYMTDPVSYWQCKNVLTEFNPFPQRSVTGVIHLTWAWFSLQMILTSHLVCMRLLLVIGMKSSSTAFVHQNSGWEVGPIITAQ